MTELRVLPEDVAKRQLPCSLCDKPARWLLWSSYLTEPALVCLEHGQNTQAIEAEVAPPPEGGTE